MEFKEASFFTFISNGMVEGDKHIDNVKSDLKDFIPDKADLIDKIIPLSDLTIAENIDFEGIVDLIKVFRNSGAGFRIELSDEMR